MLDFAKIVVEIHNLISQGDPEQALLLIKKVVAEIPDNEVQLIMSGFLIDCGDALHNIDEIQVGVKIIEQFLEKNETLENDVLLKIFYNLANGYAAAGKYYMQNANYELAEVEFQQEKKYLQKCLLSQDSLESDLRLDALTNYGNLLDHLNRTTEAIDCFQECLRINPEHSMSMINLSYAIRRLFGISESHNPKLFYHSYNLLCEALNHSENIKKVGGGHVIEGVKKELSWMESKAKELFDGDFPSLENWILDLESSDSNWRMSTHLTDIYANGLFLSLNPLPIKCEEDCRDDLFFHEFLSSIKDKRNSRFKIVCHTFNNIKEDFAVARYLYFLSESQNQDLINLSSITSYMNTLDYSDFGLRAGYLKTSLRLSFDILGKCAICLNAYLELGHDEDSIDFFNFWYVKGKYKKGFIPEVTELIKSNRFFAALNDLRKDLYVGEYPFPFKNIRNDATHKRVVISWFDPIEDETNTTHKISDFQKVVLAVLKMARAASIYLVGCITLEERKKREKLEANSEFLPSIPYQLEVGLSDGADADLFGTEEDNDW